MARDHPLRWYGLCSKVATRTEEEQAIPQTGCSLVGTSVIAELIPMRNIPPDLGHTQSLTTY